MLTASQPNRRIILPNICYLYLAYMSGFLGISFYMTQIIEGCYGPANLSDFGAFLTFPKWILGCRWRVDKKEIIKLVLVIKKKIIKRVHFKFKIHFLFIYFDKLSPWVKHVGLFDAIK